MNYMGEVHDKIVLGHILRICFYRQVCSSVSVCCLVHCYRHKLPQSLKITTFERNTRVTGSVPWGTTGGGSVPEISRKIFQYAHFEFCVCSLMLDRYFI